MRTIRTLARRVDSFLPRIVFLRSAFFISASIRIARKRRMPSVTRMRRSTSLIELPGAFAIIST